MAAHSGGWAGMCFQDMSVVSQPHAPLVTVESTTVS